MNTSLAEHVAIVTGGSRGIGAEIVKALAAEGAKVVFTFNSSEARAREVEQAVSGAGGTAIGKKCDVSDGAAVEEFIAGVAEEHGRIDVLVNNAGITRDKLLMRMTEEDWDDVMQTNLKACFNTIRASVKTMMRARKGSIINITSVVGITGNPGQANYVSSKAGLIGLTKTVAKEFGSRNITANCIAPGYVETDMTGDLNEKQREAILSQIPLGRTATPEEIAGAVVFLASEKSRYITGQVLSVDGGMHM